MDKQLAPGEKIAVTVSEAAELLSLSPPTIYQLINTVGFPCFKIGRRTLIYRAGLEDWAFSQTVRGSGEAVKIS